MKYDALIVNLRCQYERYRGSGTRMEQMLKDAGAALAKARLTDEEREAIETAAMIYEQGAKQMGHVEDGKRAVALRAMLERLV